MGLLTALFSLDRFSMQTYRASQNLSDALVALREKHQFQILLCKDAFDQYHFYDSNLDLDNLMEITLERNVAKSIKCLHIDLRGGWSGAAIYKKYGKKKFPIFCCDYTSTGLTYGATTRTDEFIDMFLRHTAQIEQRQLEI
jgi:hypothetical protein